MSDVNQTIGSGPDEPLPSINPPCELDPLPANRSCFHLQPTPRPNTNTNHFLGSPLTRNRPFPMFRAMIQPFYQFRLVSLACWQVPGRFSHRVSPPATGTARRGLAVEKRPGPQRKNPLRLRPLPDHHRRTGKFVLEGSLRRLCLPRSRRRFSNRKSVAIEPVRCEPHLELAYLVPSTRLLALPRRKIAQALADDPRHPNIPLLERRLRLERLSNSPREQVRPKSGPTWGLRNDDPRPADARTPFRHGRSFRRQDPTAMIHNFATGGCQRRAAFEVSVYRRMPLGNQTKEKEKHKQKTRRLPSHPSHPSPYRV